MAEPAAGERPDRVLTVPNLLSLIRLAGVPLFLYLLLGPRADGWAIIVLMVGGITDWLDGKLARLLGQQSRLGALLDPAVDRLYILAALVALGVREVVPWWAVGVLLARDLVLAATLPLLRRRGYGPYEVTYLGKGATFLLLYAFPLLLLGQGTGLLSDLARPAGYAFAAWGTAIYLYSGLLYLAQFVLAMRAPVGTRPPHHYACGVIPEDLHYTDAHEWVRELGGGVVRIGITDHAQSQLGDVVFVQLPAVGDTVSAGSAVGEVESTKSVSDLYAPLSGTVVAVNDALRENPELINSGPYEAGWMIEVEAPDGVPAGLLDAAGYRELTAD